MQSDVARASLVDLLVNGDDTPKNIAERIDRHRKSVSDKLEDLESEGYVENKGGGVRKLTVDGVRMAQAIRREGVS